MKKKLIIYELNEVPLKLINYYCKLYPRSSFSKIKSKGLLKKTYTYDSGELHPWVTWPTLHRGVGNDVHKITSINQDLNIAKDYPPIWEKLLEKKIDIGIFGSLQSYPPIRNKFVKFYVPDTFSPSNKTFPKYLSIFQTFNLYLAGKNKAIPSNFNFKSVFLFIKLACKFPKIFKVIFELLFQVINEFINPINKIRRSLFQPVIGFEIYSDLVKKFNPSYTSFFTNHVAGVMHKYWKYLFSDKKLNKKEKFFAQSIIKAMKIADKEIERLIRLADIHDYTILILTSMGQDLINRGEYIPELYLENFNLFLKSLGLDASKYDLKPAMQPDICISSSSFKDREDLRKAIKRLKSTKKENLIIERYEPKGLNVNFSLKTIPIIAESNNLVYEKQIFDLSRFGLKTIITN